MTSSFELRPSRFVAGTVGPPGRRVFYLQASEDANVVSLRLEKQQVAALAEYLAGILADLPAPDELTMEDTELVTPVIAEWVIGSLAVAYEESEDRILIVAEELVATDDASDAGPEDPAVARFRLSRAQVAHFVQHAMEVVMSGRPPCPICGHAMDPEGHVCPKTNGHRAP